MGDRWKIPVTLSTLREQWVWLHLRPNVQVINSRQCANSSCCISARTCEYVLNTIYSNNIFIGTSSYRISLARCCGGYLLSLSAMLWTAISSAVAAAAAAVLEMLSLAMFPIATLGIFEFPPKKVLDQNISNPFEFKQILWISMDVVSWHVAKPDHFFFDTKKQRKKHSAGPPVHLNHPKPNAVVGMAGCHMLMGTWLQACKAPEQHLGGHLDIEHRRCPTR